jgi:hypothetical protein
MLRRVKKLLEGVREAIDGEHQHAEDERDGEHDPADMVRVIAVDWSGARTGAERTIWLAEVHGDAVVRLENGRTREGIGDDLIARADRDRRLVIGLDFAFSLPEWFLVERGLPDGPALWALAVDEAETWLAECLPPFWGRPGTKRPALAAHSRWTEEITPAIRGIRPKSVFQVGGAGAVGTGSLRGMPLLHGLHAAGFHIWPFDQPGWPLVVEIYPRLLTGAVTKSNGERRAAYLAARYPTLTAAITTAAAGSEDAFDACISALVMAEYRRQLAALPAVTDPVLRREGLIWHPDWQVSLRAGGRR